ncbi:unnamed protein product [Alternaria alternata]|uniref:Hypervirulence associated protein TUDOR domain-containing protein n=1 Tax=Alternaria alternata TaxID=5599 RepID=A0A4Q4NXZ2_ALTAL|nr:hypothetical protein AA0117_g1688 [Alternaria alternata]
MSSQVRESGRTDPPGNDESSDEEDFNYPTAPLYKIGEEVYVQAHGQNQPTGPYEVVTVLAGNKYRLKLKATGVEQRDLISQDKLLVRA